MPRLRVVALRAAINGFVAEHNLKPKPFVWTADPNAIIEKVRRGIQVLESIHWPQARMFTTRLMWQHRPVLFPITRATLAIVSNFEGSGEVKGRIEIASRNRARRIKRRFDAVVTIEDSDQRLTHRLRFHRKPAPDHLVLAFEDLDYEHPRIRTATSDDIERILEFGRHHVDGSLLVHCNAGISRSPAAALAILADQMGSGFEATALDALLSICPEVVLNLLIVRHADSLLDRKGVLLETILRWDAALAANAVRRALNEETVLSSFGYGSS